MPEFSWKNVLFVPILHGRMEFAAEVRRQFHQHRPDCVAVEYPYTLREQIFQGIRRLPFLSVAYYEEDGEFIYLLIEPTDGQVEAVRLALEHGIPVHFVDRHAKEYPVDLTPFPDPYSITRIGYEAYCQAFLAMASRGRSPSNEDVLREKAMAFNLQRLSKQYERVLFVGGLYHVPGVMEMLDSPQARVIGPTKARGAGVAHLHEDSSRELMTEMPFLCAQYEEARADGDLGGLDRLYIQNQLIKEARKEHKKKNREELSPWQLRVLHRFARNYALITGKLVPNFYQLIVAARGAADDNFAYEVWLKGSEYPWQTENPGLSVLRLSGEDLFLDQKRIRFHRRIKTFRRRLISVKVKRSPSSREAARWKKEFGAFSICSYPPEDVVVEGYGQYLQKRAMEIRTEEQSSIEPFMASMLDGIDIRQTIREWGSGKIYVRHDAPFRGKVGSVVVIFDPDYPDKEGKERFPWCVTWLGEHEQESDMAFYSTPAGEVVVGPGISRCQYGGFMLTYPPMRVFDIWKDPLFDFARSKPERLLLAAIDYSMEKNIVYVAGSPPSGWCKSFAARQGKKIIYMPIGIFSPVTLRKIRQFHVLDGHHVRRYAQNYIDS